MNDIIETPARTRSVRSRSQFIRSTLLKELLLFVTCFLCAYPIAGFAYGLRDSDAGPSLDINLLDGLASAVVMAIQTTTSFGFVSLGTVEDIGDGDMLNMYPDILRCAVVVFVIANGLWLLGRLAFRRSARR